MFGLNFSKCPHFYMAGGCPDKIKSITDSLLERKESDRELAKTLNMHIEQDIIAHKETNETLRTLIKDKEKRDIVRDKREKIREKVYISVGLAILYGSYNFFLNLYDISKALGVEK